MQLLRNTEVQRICLWCCAPPDFVIQINNVFSLVLFPAVIRKRKGKKLISKTIKYKLNSSSKMQFVFFFYRKDIQKIVLENYWFFRKCGNYANNREQWVMCSLRHYDAMRTKIDMWFYPNRDTLYFVYLYLCLRLSLFILFLWSIFPYNFHFH